MKKPTAFPTGKASSILCAKACDISAMNRLSPSSAQVASQPFYAWDWLRPGTIGLTILLAILCLFVLSPIYLLLTSAAQVEGAGNIANFSLAPWRTGVNENKRKKSTQLYIST